MRRNIFLSENQHGCIKGSFMHGKACLSSGLMEKKLYSGRSIHVAYLDVMKAFDTVSHQCLLVQLSSYGIVGKIRSG